MKDGEGTWTQPVSQSVSHLHAFKLEEWELWMAVKQAEEITGTDDLRYPPNASLIVSHHLSTYLTLLAVISSLIITIILSS